ncbi:MAG: IMPACT family protein [Candidatus Kapaibacteriales bacterium]
MKRTILSPPSNFKYKTIAKPITSELRISNSRFIANAFPINSTENAINIIQQIRKKFYDATHNCFAFIIGPNNEYYRYNDDREPIGTAGKPIFQAILHSGLTNLLVVVTRYFGGIKLGTSGLISAYYESAKNVLSNAEIIEICNTKILHITIDYENHPKLQHLFRKFSIQFQEKYKSWVEISADIPIDLIEPLIDKIQMICSGKANIEIIENKKGD